MGVHLQDISVLQKKAIRVVTNDTYKSHTEPIFKEYGLLNVNVTCVFCVCLFIFSTI